MAKHETKSVCFKREYKNALREFATDIAEMGYRKVPKHLRVAMHSHAKGLANLRCDIRPGRGGGSRRRKAA